MSVRLVTKVEQINNRGSRYTILPPFDSNAVQKKLLEGYYVDTVNYHWDDRRKLERDYRRYESAYEKLLLKLARSLNEYHDVDRSLRYWRIIVGPWLYVFVGILIDRWEMLSKVVSETDIMAAESSESEIKRFVPENIREINMYYDVDFSALIYSEMLSAQIPKKVVYQYNRGRDDGHSFSRRQEDSKRVGSRRTVTNYFKKILWQSLGRKRKYFVHLTGLNGLQLAFLNCQLKQIPLGGPNYSEYSPNVISPNKNRLEIRHNSDTKTFEYISERLIGKMIPVRYLEGYKDACNYCDKLLWPTNPKVIFSTQGWADEIFKFWAAAKVESGSKLMMGQHGGAIGLGKLQISENHQIEIADKFLTWGWADSRIKTVPAIGLARVLGRSRFLAKKNGGIMLVMTVIPNVTMKVQSTPLGESQSNKYFQEQCRFIDNLEPEINNCLTVRIHRELERSVRTEYSKKLKGKFPALMIDPSEIEITAQANANRLSAYSYRGTGYLETLAHNFPTVIFWDPNMWEIKDNAEPYLDLLRNAGIYHSTPESAAAHINLVWGNINDWWDTKLVQEAREEFCRRYARREKHGLRILRNRLVAEC